MKLRELLAEEIDKKVLTASKECDFSAIARGICALNIGPRKMSRLLNEIYVEYNKSGALIACDILDERIEGMVKALERIKNGTHEKYPVCAHIGVNNFGPPRTDGWEGWAREIDSAHKNIAKEALEKFKKGMGR